jgi:F420-dependent oxidoreductase-like protein
VKLSLYLPMGTTQEFAGRTDPLATLEAVVDVARTADEVGFETVWLPDHFMPFGPPGAYVFEAWTTIAALARETRRVRLGHLVSGNGYRNPALMAKMASTLDVLSAGRFTFGVGAGWYAEEYRAFGYEFPPARERLAMLEEALQLVHGMWSGEATTFTGEHFRTDGVVNQPVGVQAPHPPVMVAGGGEKVTLRLVAQYADLCNVQEPPHEVERKLAILADHCVSVGRDVRTITKTSTTYCIVGDTDEEARARVPAWTPLVFPGDVGSYGLVGTVDTIRARLAVYEAAGVDELIVGFLDGLDVDLLRRFAGEFIGSPA